MIRYVDETGYNEVDKNEEGAVLDLEAMELFELEAHLNINPVRDFNKDKDSKLFDGWFEVASELKYLRDLSRDPSYMVSILGYELIEDNHFIKLYYSVRNA